MARLGSLALVLAVLALAPGCGGGAGYVCLARHPLGAYADSCEPRAAAGASVARHFRALHAAAACTARVEEATVVTSRRACFDLVWSSRTSRTVCMARLDDCEAQRAALRSDPSTYARFTTTLASVPGDGVAPECIAADAPVTGEPFAGDCSWR